ncbi:glycerol-3-phosphate 1-O-acyltransferase PlsY [Alphaproteobacteria bacterium]|nr:glycerol-3-phosphate 1-O-acyltransferase PlsY [Alphaproteobacteria bacterium]
MINDLNYYWILISLFLFGYFIGSIPFGLILTKLSGLGDIRNIGSGNIGATNVLRTGNKKIALLTLILDGGKGALAIFITSLFFKFLLIRNFIDLEALQSLVAIGAVAGHCFPVWLRFRGGKGVATGFGSIITLNFFVGLIALLIWITTAKIFKISSMSALLAYFLIPILMFFNSTENYFLIASLMISSICWFQHRENIRRLINGSEPKI